MANPKKIPHIDHMKCYGCKCCLFDCPVNAFDLIHPITKRGMRRTLPEFVRKEDCIGCGVCAKACPFDVIEMVDNPDYKAPAKKTEVSAEAAAAVAAGTLAATANTAEFDNDKAVKIFADNCRGCTACARACPVSAIKGEVKKAHEIAQDECIRCGACFETCKFNAIYQGEVLPEKAPAKKPAPAKAAGAAAAAERPPFDPDQDVKILAEKCKGCTLCAKQCPVGAIKGEVKNPHEIDQAECIHCGACYDTCKFGAIYQGDAPSAAAPAAKATPAAAAAAAGAAGPVLATAENSEFDPDKAVRIFAEKCKGCTMCAKQCPVGAINGEVKKPHEIDQDTCIRCGACFDTCKFGAIYQGDEVSASGAAKPAEAAAAPAAAAAAAKPAAPAKKAAPKPVEHAPLNRDFPLRIDPNACKGCTMCARNCPEACITGGPKVPHVINEDLCSRCGTCWDVCKFNAIYNSDDPVPALVEA